jgi:hypothetical protein
MPIYGGPMKRDERSVEEQAARLSHRDRARLALRLIESLESGQDEDVDGLWLDEAEQRLRKYDQGATQARDAEDATTHLLEQSTPADVHAEAKTAGSVLDGGAYAATVRFGVSLEERGQSSCSTRTITRILCPCCRLTSS